MHRAAPVRSPTKRPSLRPREHARMSANIAYLGWGALEIQLGSPTPAGTRFAPVTLDWQPGDIHNCSYATRHAAIGITAEDRSLGQQVLAVYNTPTATTRVLLRADHVLRHAFNHAETGICYTQPSARLGAADLLLCDLNSGDSRRLAEAAVAPGGTPAWFPDDARIAYESPDGQIEAWSLAAGQREILVEGFAPAVHPRGQQLAFRRGDQLLIFDLAARTAAPLPIRRGWLQQSLADGLSWSPDGRYLSFGLTAGLVAKETTFILLDPVTNEQKVIAARYLRGLIMIDTGASWADGAGGT
jgi:hypothetical protein